MSRQFTREFYLEVAKGNIARHTAERKFGHNESVGTTNEVIWDGEGDYNWLASAQTINLSSSSDADNGGTATGALTLTIYGLDANYALQNETKTLNGQTIVTTDNTYRRIYRLIIATEGSTAMANTGDIYAYTGTESSGVPNTATQIYAKIGATHGQTLMTPYTVPAGKTAYLASGWATSGAGKNAGVQFFARPDGGARNLKFDFDILDADFAPPITLPLVFPEKTDVWVEAKVGAGTTKVSAGYDFILIDN